MDPVGNHGLGDAFLSEFIHFCFSESEVSIKDYNDFRIKREKFVRDKDDKGRTDIIAVSVKNTFVMCIENKIRSKERVGQLEIYKKGITGIYKGYNCRFLFLTPKRDSASDPTTWKAISYQDVLDILEKIMKTHDSKINTDQRVFIYNYIGTLRREIVGNEELNLARAEIYKEHKKALDLLFEYRESKFKNFREWARTWAEQNKNITVGEPKRNKANGRIYLRFTTPKMSDVIIKDDKDGGWGTKDHYFYELEVNESEATFWMQLVISGENLDGDNKKIADKIQKFDPSDMQPKKEDWDWHTHLHTDPQYRVFIDETMTKDSCEDILDQLFKDLMIQETKLLDELKKIPKFCR